MVKSLLAPYEQRPWAQTNWILVRLWRVSQQKGKWPREAKGKGHLSCSHPTDAVSRAAGLGTAIPGCHTC